MTKKRKGRFVGYVTGWKPDRDFGMLRGNSGWSISGEVWANREDANTVLAAENLRHAPYVNYQLLQVYEDNGVEEEVMELERMFRGK